MEENKKWKILFYVVAALGVWLFGFYLGRKTIKIPEPEVITDYITLPAIHDSIPYPKPYFVHFPTDTADVIKDCVKKGIYQELFPEKTITEYIDTAKTIINDWGAERKYSEVLFDNDSLGKFEVTENIQFNRLMLRTYNYAPKQKTTTKTVYVVKAFKPFAGLGALVNPWDKEKDPMAKVTAGFVVKDKYGFQVDYQHAFKSKKDYIGGTFLLNF